MNANRIELNLYKERELYPQFLRLLQAHEAVSASKDLGPHHLLRGGFTHLAAATLEDIRDYEVQLGPVLVDALFTEGVLKKLLDVLQSMFDYKIARFYFIIFNQFDATYPTKAANHGHRGISGLHGGECTLSVCLVW